MELELSSFSIVIALTIGFTLASILGLVAHWLKLSPIVGYLLAGYVVGPYFPGYVIDVKLSEELAEIGVVLMLFGVGMHFNLKDMLRVKNIAIIGGVGQTFIATAGGALLVQLAGFPLSVGITTGLAISVASTVVLVRVLEDNRLLDTTQGHVAVGWLIVEDIFTVVILILLPIYAQAINGMAFSLQTIAYDLTIVALKISLLFILMFTIGKKAVSYFLTKIVKTHSQELFTVAILALTLLIATGASFFFGVSIALGAFIAGMVIGETALKHRVTANSLPLRDAFSVLFFISVGTLFNPVTIIQHWPLFLCVLTVILLVKPLAAFSIVKILGKPTAMAATVAVSLAQIGEFSFILAEEAWALKIMPDDALDMIVAAALISIALNPLLFKTLLKYIGSHKPHKPHRPHTN